MDKRSVQVGGHMFSNQKLFNRTMVENSPLSLEGDRTYDMLTNHVRYYRPEMELVVPNAKYFTVLRDPVRQFESSFGYFGWEEKMEGSSDPLGTFTENLSTHFEQADLPYWWQMKNGQIYDLGLDHSYHDNETAVTQKITEIERELDFVLITEYFDESLVILKQILCWELHYMLYIPNGIRSQKYVYKIKDRSRANIIKWNKADMMLYRHFNRTLWQRIESYGSNFEYDLNEFRRQRQIVTNQCLDGTMSPVRGTPRWSRVNLKRGAPSICYELWKGDATYTKILRERQNKGGIKTDINGRQIKY
ncbi:galactosylceramide sulfotransferase-like [Saccoglossus kowalevskii]